MGRAHREQGKVAYYFGLGDDEPTETVLEPRSRREWIALIGWLIATLFLAVVVIDVLAIWALPTPVDLVAVMGIAGAAVFAAGAVQLCCDRVLGR
jgi:hypothetical protein